MQEIQLKTLTIRGIDEKLASAIRRESREKNTSINQIALKILRQAVGLMDNPVFKKYDDLDHLAGTWTDKEEREFIKKTKQFGKIDQEIWQ